MLMQIMNLIKNIINLAMNLQFTSNSFAESPNHQFCSLFDNFSNTQFSTWED